MTNKFLSAIAFLFLVSMAYGQAPDCGTGTSHQFHALVTDIQTGAVTLDVTFPACGCVPVAVSSTDVECPVPTPSPTPVPTPSPTPMPTPTPSPIPSPTPVPQLTTVTFDPSPNACCQINNVYMGIDWGVSQWAWEGKWPPFSTNNFFFNNSTGTSRKFTFINPHILISLQTGTDKAGTLTISDDSGQTLSVFVPVSSTPMTIQTGWVKPAKVVTFTFTAGWAVDFDNLVYQ